MVEILSTRFCYVKFFTTVYFITAHSLSSTSRFRIRLKFLFVSEITLSEKK